MHRYKLDAPQGHLATAPHFKIRFVIGCVWYIMESDSAPFYSEQDTGVSTIIHLVRDPSSGSSVMRKYRSDP